MPIQLKETEVQDWFNNINLSFKWREPETKKWERIIDYLRNLYFDEASEQDRICVNYIHPHVRVVIPSVYSRNPDIMVTPRKYEDNLDYVCLKRAEAMQNLLRYYLKELDIKTEVKLCILDALLCGHAWVKTGYETEFAEIDEISEEPLISRFLKRIGVKEQDNKLEDKLNIKNEKIIAERPWVIRTSIFDMIVPAFSRRNEELPWIGERILVPYKDVLNNPDYDTEGLKESCNGHDLLEKMRSIDKKKLGEFGKDMKYCVLYEIWERDSESVITLCDGHKRPLKTEDSEYTFLDSKYHPYLSLRFNEVPDQYYPMGDIEAAEPQIEEYNEIRTKFVNHLRRFNRKYKTRPSALTPEGKAALREGEDGAIIEVSDTYDDKPLDDIINPIQDAPLPPEIYATAKEVKESLLTILGTVDYAHPAGQARTATEVSVVASQGRARVEERIDQVQMFAERIVRNLAMISQKFMTQQQVGAILGPDGIYWLQIHNNSEIRGEFQFGIVYGSTTPVSKDIDREQYKAFYSTVVGDPYWNQIKIRHEYARKHDLPRPETWLDPEIAQMLQQQLLASVRMGMLDPSMGPGSTNRSGSPEQAPKPQGQGSGGNGGVRDSQAFGGMLTGGPQAPSRPGGKGGTQDRSLGGGY